MHAKVQPGLLLTLARLAAVGNIGTDTCYQFFNLVLINWPLRSVFVVAISCKDDHELAHFSNTLLPMSVTF